MQPALDMPEVLWKSFIDFESGEGEDERVRSLYERLLKRTIHPKVWLSYALFELGVGSGGVDKNEQRRFLEARKILERGYGELKTHGLQEERRIMLNMWIDFENDHYQSFSGVADIRGTLAEKRPQQVKKRRRLNPDDPGDQAMEEYFDYVFPEDEEEEKARKGAGVSKLLAMARQWKQQKSVDNA
jgi:crooked neck